MKIKALLEEASRDLADKEQVRWTPESLVGFFNDFMRRVITAFPHSNAVREPFLAEAGKVRHRLPDADYAALLDVESNTDALGDELGESITFCDQRTLAVQFPSWRTHEFSGRFYHYMIDPKDPRSFDLYPVPTQDAYVMILAGKHLEPIVEADIGQGGSDPDFALEKAYIDPTRDWVMYRALMMDTGNGSTSKAQFYLQAVGNALGQKVTTDQGTSEAQTDA